MNEYRIKLNTIESEKSKLRAGDALLISGTIYTARDAAHKRFFELLDAEKELPFPLEGATVYYAGPTVTAPGNIIGSCGPTTSKRMDAFTPRLLDLGLSVIIGKGGRNEATREAFLRNKALYLASIGGAGALYSTCVKKCDVIAFEDLGCESVKRLTVENFPVYVAYDIYGGSIYDL